MIEALLLAVVLSAEAQAAGEPAPAPAPAPAPRSEPAPKEPPPPRPISQYPPKTGGPAQEVSGMAKASDFRDSDLSYLEDDLAVTRACEGLTQRTLGPPPHHMSRYRVTDPSGELVDDWRARVQRFRETGEDMDVGEVSCSAQIVYLRRGRAPMGALPGLVEGADGVAVLARQAQEEALAVHAFEELADQLEALSVAPSLVARARRAADEERDHAARIGALVRAGGGAVPPAEAPPRRPASLTEVALHNAVVGCIQETWAAAMETARARRAPAHAATFAAIARDERSHAALAWDLHAALLPRLSVDERAAVRAAMRRALALLARDLTRPSPGLAALGEPDLAHQGRLFADFAARIAPHIDAPAA